MRCIGSSEATLVTTVAFCLGLTVGLVLGWCRGYTSRASERRR